MAGKLTREATSTPTASSPVSSVAGRVSTRSSRWSLAWFAVLAVAVVSTLNWFPPPTEVRSAVSEISPVVPGRLLDTRSGPGAETVDGNQLGAGRVDAGSTTAVDVVDRAGLPDSIAAAFLNVTVVNSDDTGFLTVFPCGSTVPLAANLNYTAGDIIANAVLAKVGTGSQVCIFSSAETHLVVDVNGYVPVGGSPSPLAPARLLETRSGPNDDTVDGRFLGDGRAESGSITMLEVTNRGGVPDGATSVMLNVTAIKPSGTGYVTVFPCGEDQPTAANLNYFEGDVISNAVLAKVGANGMVCVFTFSETHLVVDVNGFVDAGNGPASIAPARYLETRADPRAETFDNDFVGDGRVGDASTTKLPIAGRGLVPATAEAVMLNVTAVRPSAVGFVTVFPCGEDQPTAANLNYGPDDVIANAVFAKIGDGGEVCVYSEKGTHLVVDVTGFVDGAPEPDLPSTTVGPAPTVPDPTVVLDPGEPIDTIDPPPPTTAAPAGSLTSGNHSVQTCDLAGNTLDCEAIVNPVGVPSNIVRWNPCAPIRYLVNAEGASALQVSRMNDAIAFVEQASGIDFEYIGETDQGERALSNDPADNDFPDGADAVFVFSDPQRTPELGNANVLGLGGSGIFTFGPGKPIFRDQGFMIVRTDLEADIGLTAVFMHEIGHMIGLEHVMDPSEVMNPVIDLGAPLMEFGPGDREGFWKLGAAQSCIDTGTQLIDGAITGSPMSTLHWHPVWGT